MAGGALFPRIRIGGLAWRPLREIRMSCATTKLSTTVCNWTRVNITRVYQTRSRMSKNKSRTWVGGGEKGNLQIKLPLARASSSSKTWCNKQMAYGFICMTRTVHAYRCRRGAKDNLTQVLRAERLVWLDGLSPISRREQWSPL